MKGTPRQIQYANDIIREMEKWLVSLISEIERRDAAADKIKRPDSAYLYGNVLLSCSRYRVHLDKPLDVTCIPKIRLLIEELKSAESAVSIIETKPKDFHDGQWISRLMRKRKIAAASRESIF